MDTRAAPCALASIITLALLACSPTVPPSTAPPTQEAAPTPNAQDAPPDDRTEAPLDPRETSMTWTDAEKLLRTSRGDDIEILQRWQKAPFLFQVRRGAETSFVLIHNGAIVERKGLPALGAYLKAIDALGQQTLDTQAMLHLLHAFEALPTEAECDGYLSGERYFYGGGAHVMDPKLEWKAGGATMTLHYLPAPRTAPPDGPSIGAPSFGAPPSPRPAKRTFLRWELVVRPNYQLRAETSEVLEP